MILQLSIRNFALIEKAEVDFNNGFNVIYGETGSGKSILIDAINFVVGGRFNKDIIRTGEDKAYVEATFVLDKNKIEKIIKKLDLDEDDTICISREIFLNNKSIVKVNGRTVTLSSLRDISKELIDIHGQHQNQMLFDKESYIPLLDSYDDNMISSLLTDYEKEYNNLKVIKDKIAELSGNEDNEKLQSFLEFQINEIDKAKLKKDEEQNLNEEYKLLSNAQKINTAVNTSYALLNDSNNSMSVIDNLYTINKELSSVEDFSDKISKINNDILNSYYSLQECARDLRSLGDEVVYDDVRLESINERLFKIASLKKKYGDSIEKILEYREKINTQYNELKNSKDMIEQLNIKETAIIKELRELGRDIHNIRIKNASRLEKDIQDNLKYIGLERCKIKIDLRESDKIKFNGTDECEFLVSTNTGEPFKEIDKVASGGELSRIMLAIKAVFVDKDKVPTVVFDEIDTGISGRIAHCVGEKMYEIAANHQVFCITHLPQIASFSDYHYLVKKTVANGKTYSNITRLTDDEKVIEIAKMLGGNAGLESSLENAKSIIEYASEKQREILKK